MTDPATKQISPQTSRELIHLQRHRAKCLVEYDEMKDKIKLKKDELKDIMVQVFAHIRDEDPDGTLYAKGDQ